MSDGYFGGDSGDHYCDVRHRGHYDPCGCTCAPCTAAREPKPKATVISTKACVRCGATIHLVAAGNHYKWVTDPNRAASFHCGHDPLLPVLAHAPKEELGG